MAIPLKNGKGEFWKSDNPPYWKSIFENVSTTKKNRADSTVLLAVETLENNDLQGVKIRLLPNENSPSSLFDGIALIPCYVLELSYWLS